MASSSRLRALIDSQNEELPLDMSPMIDLVFQLLFFFMVGSHLVTLKVDARVNHPTAANAKVEENATGKIVINLLADGSAWDNTPEELPTSDAITDFISQFKENYSDSTPVRLHLRADRDVDTREIKRVVEAASKAGVTDVIFGTYVVESSGD